MEKEYTLDNIVSLAKRRGFIYQGSEIYGGLAGTWDYGPLGVTLKNNIKNLWWRMFVESRSDMYGIDAAILMHPRVWEASGHVAGFSDPLVECSKCKRRFRADHVEEAKQRANENNFDIKAMLSADKELLLCDKNDSDKKREHAFGPVRQFNMMFKTHVGAMEDETSISYLRPETAGGMFVNFKNVVDSFHPKLPFGLAQIGKAFRNEIAPRDFVFRSREFEQMEVEYFVAPENWETKFEEWRQVIWNFITAAGITKDGVHELEVADEDRAHYSKRTIDFEFDFPFGRKELYGLAYRTDFDLSAHAKTSTQPLMYTEEGKEPLVPHVIEPSLGVDRTILAVLSSAYKEEEVEGEKRAYLKFAPSVAPVKAAIFPLLKNKPELVGKAREIFDEVKKVVPQIMWDDNGNIGKRYRRQDEIGTPFCVTVDFDTLSDNTVTVRDRDTMKQERIPVSGLVSFITAKING